jgi:hypothetical protein
MKTDCIRTTPSTRLASCCASRRRGCATLWRRARPRSTTTQEVCVRVCSVLSRRVAAAVAASWLRRLRIDREHQPLCAVAHQHMHSLCPQHTPQQQHQHNATTGNPQPKYKLDGMKVLMEFPKPKGDEESVNAMQEVDRKQVRARARASRASRASSCAPAVCVRVCMPMRGCHAPRARHPPCCCARHTPARDTTRDRSCRRSTATRSWPP